ncbi:MAG: chemotaxis protein CheA [Candidatus Marinimicrobia bacterium]|nr:chemotaxis protein CheA [Candidatus Neomarinimicrobiota bacterium]
MSVYDNLVGMEEVLDEFIVETTELLEEVNEDLVHLESDPDDDLVNRIFRAFHTFKGTCGFLGFTQAKDVAHVAEDILNQLRNGKIQPSSAIIDNLLESCDWFSQFINDVKEREEKDYEIAPLIAKLEAARDGAEAPVASVPANGSPAAEEPAGGEEVAAGNGKPVDEALEETDGQAVETAPPAENGEPVAPLPEVAREESASDLIHHIDDQMTKASQQVTTDNVGELSTYFDQLISYCNQLQLPKMAHVIEKTHDYLVAVEKGKLDPSADGNVAIVEAMQWIKEILEDAEDGKPVDAGNSVLVDDIEVLLHGPSTAKDSKGKRGDQKAQATPAQTIRVDMERLENLMNLAGELVLSRNQLGQAYTDLSAVKTSDASIDNLDQVNNALGRITTEIQEAVMQMRMLPISNVFRKFPRVVRDLSKAKGKEVELVLIGEETELDRSVIEAISDPLLHLVRNSVDHGVETPDIRRAKGKPEIGIVTLKAAHEGNHIVIEIEDDGAGIDADKLVAKALEKGVIGSVEADTMTQRDKLNLIFKPGFSTAAKVTDVSGRGVGMDVVHTNVSKLNGSIDIETKIGVGSKMTIKLPLTLAIVTGLKVAVWDEEYIIPFSSIIETVKLDKSALTKVEDKWVMRFRDSVVNTLYLDDWFEVKSKRNEDQEYYAVVVSVAEFRYALVVTGLKGQEEAVIKPLGQVLGRIPGIAGGTIGGDGVITLILDIPELVQSMGLG